VRYVNIFLPQSAPEGATDELIDRILLALREQPHARDATTPDRADSPPYVRLSTLGGAAPPVGVPILNEELRVLSVPAPVGGAEAVRVGLMGVAEGLDVEESGDFHTQEG